MEMVSVVLANVVAEEKNVIDVPKMANFQIVSYMDYL